MTNEKMEQRLAAALKKTAPDDVNGVLSRCEERKGTVIPMTTKKTANRKWTSLIAACLAVMLLGGGGVFYQRANAVASVVSLDVNPSIELKVNRSEKVLVCTPLNEDAKAILADMGNGADLKGAKLDVAVNDPERRVEQHNGGYDRSQQRRGGPSGHVPLAQGGSHRPLKRREIKNEER